MASRDQPLVASGVRQKVSLLWLQHIDLHDPHLFPDYQASLEPILSPNAVNEGAHHGLTK